MAGLPALGTPAPDFTLPSTNGADVTLSKLEGKNVLLAFFPLAFTRVCTTEMYAFSEEYDRFRSFYEPAFGYRLAVIRGNHDSYYGGTFASDAPYSIELPGITLAVLDTATPN
ncbi:MAG: redoxin domain-containing protein, partial [Gemmatimonadales bacterium]